MNSPVEWFAAIGTILAAGMIAGDLGRKITGWAFVLFTLVSAVWMASALSSGTMPLAIQNAIMICVNGWGIWQYLLSPKNRQKLKRMEQLEHQAEEDIQAGRA